MARRVTLAYADKNRLIFPPRKSSLNIRLCSSRLRRDTMAAKPHDVFLQHKLANKNAKNSLKDKKGRKHDLLNKKRPFGCFFRVQ